jgi:hypothetical protein
MIKPSKLHIRVQRSEPDAPKPKLSKMYFPESTYYERDFKLENDEN